MSPCFLAFIQHVLRKKNLLMGVHIVWISSSFVLCSEVNAITLRKCFSLTNSLSCWMPKLNANVWHDVIWHRVLLQCCIVSIDHVLSWIWIQPPDPTPLLLSSHGRQWSYCYRNNECCQQHEQSLMSVALWSGFLRVIPPYDAQESWFSAVVYVVFCSL